MSVFTRNDFNTIRKELINESSNFTDILFSDKYIGYQIYLLYSKEPMDDWELEGAFFSKERALRKINALRESFGYPNLPININVEPRSIETIAGLDSESRIIGWLGFDFPEAEETLGEKNSSNLYAYM